MNYSLIILCAGQGTRTGLGYNKMLYKIDGITIYQKSLQVFLNDSLCKQIIVVTSKEEISIFKDLVNDSRLEFVIGGNQRQDSVYNGLSKVKYDYVLIHDGARPYLKATLINNLLTSLKTYNACLLMVDCKDTIKIVENNIVKTTLNRDTLKQAQTPQAFKTSLIKQVHNKALLDNFYGTDDASLIEKYSNELIYCVQGDYENIKITTPEDLK